LDPIRTGLSGPIRLQGLTAYENGVEDVVAFLTDGITRRSSSALMDEQKREGIELS
jgi:hypothetical protein